MKSMYWLLSLLLLSFVSLPAQQSDEDKLEAVKEFQKQFRKFKEPAMQVEAVMTLKGAECPEAADELLRLLKHPTADVQNAALAVIESFQSPKTFQAWIDGYLALKDAEAQATLAKVFGRAKGPGGGAGAREALAQRAQSQPGDEV
ncbi:MAG: hypothetical protein IPK26_23985 [Planctomycetes bacterium]|nr:hypothetical protein [Planctomycetota bacterium]